MKPDTKAAANKTAAANEEAKKKAATPPAAEATPTTAPAAEATPTAAPAAEAAPTAAPAAEAAPTAAPPAEATPTAAPAEAAANATDPESLENSIQLEAPAPTNDGPVTFERDGVKYRFRGRVFHIKGRKVTAAQLVLEENKSLLDFLYGSKSSIIQEVFE